MSNTKTKQNDAGMVFQDYPTATLRAVNVPLPKSVEALSKFIPGERIDLFIPERGRITACRADPKSQTALTITCRSNNLFVYGETALALANLRSGDVVHFDQVESGKLSFRSIDPLQDPLYLSPRCDEFGHPIPPGWLAQAFTGLPDSDVFMSSGRRTANIIAEWAAAHGLPVSQAERILDFGCGCGRVISFMADLTNAELIGCDLHLAAIRWCEAHLHTGCFFHGKAEPPLPLPTDKVDILYAVSVLTHLNESMQHAWLGEWQRVVRTGGLVIATFHGDDYVAKHLSDHAEYKKNIEALWNTNVGIAFVDDGAWARVFPDCYQTTFHKFEYVKRVWSQYFDIVAIKNSGKFSNRQDAVIMRKR